MPPASFAERIQAARPRLSKSFQRLADYILDSYVQAALMTASELAHEVDVDSATVVRFAQALDYSGFPELQDEIKARVLEDFLIREEEVRPDSLAAQIGQSLGALSEAVERARRVQDPEKLEELVGRLTKSKRVLLLPDGPAHSAARDLQRHLATVGLPAAVLGLDAEALATALAASQPGDMLLALDISGDQPLLARALRQARQFGLDTAALVGGASFASARRAGLVLDLGHQGGAEAGGVVVAALVHALGDGLRWQQAARAAEIAERVQAAQKGLSAA